MDAADEAGVSLSILELAVEAGRAAGLDCDGAVVLREHASTLVELPRARVIARVEPPGRRRLAEKQAWIARLFELRDAPTVRLAPSFQQALVRREGAVTLWERLQPCGHRVSYGEFGHLVRHLHDAVRARYDRFVPPAQPFDRTLRDLRSPGPGFDERRLETLCQRTEEHLEAWPVLCREDPLGHLLIHGDCHLDNVVATERGPILVDLEDGGLGPASWDLAVLAVHARRYRGCRAEDFESFLEGYGADPRPWSGFESLCRLYELMVAAWAIHCCRELPEMLAEARLREATLFGEAEEPWKLS